MFGWFRKRRAPRVLHEDLGALELDSGVWCGEIDVPPAGGRVQLYVRDSEGTGLSGAPAVIEEFRRRFGELRPAFAVELRDLFEPWYAEFWGPDEPLEQGEPLLERFLLSSIEVDPLGVREVVFVLRDGWDDAAFRVSLEGWIPKGLGVDD